MDGYISTELEPAGSRYGDQLGELIVYDDKTLIEIKHIKSD